jgi:hypothetical protein
VRYASCSATFGAMRGRVSPEAETSRSSKLKDATHKVAFFVCGFGLKRCGDV